jgi:hypothetical protein
MSIEVRILSGGWRSRLDPSDGIEVWEGDQLVTTLPGAWLYDAVGQALSLAHLALPLFSALQKPVVAVSQDTGSRRRRSPRLPPRAAPARLA